MFENKASEKNFLCDLILFREMRQEHETEIKHLVNKVLDSMEQTLTNTTKMLNQGMGTRSNENDTSTDYEDVQASYLALDLAHVYEDFALRDRMKQCIDDPTVISIMIGDRMMADLTEEVWRSEKCYLACKPNEYKCATGPSGSGGRGHVKRLEIDGPGPKSTFGTPDGLDQEIQANDDGQILDFEAWQLAVADSYSWTDASSSTDIASSTDVSGLIDTDNEGDLAPRKVKPGLAKTKDDKIVARGFCAEKGIHCKPVCHVDAGKSSTNFPTWGMNQYW
ncbi:hypothetical protein LTS18_001017, partial [Coniosporium uncinatum]